MSFAHICHLVFVCLSVEFFVTSHCYKSGAPPESCEDMLPSGHGADPQTSPAPFIISTDADCYNVSTPITVTVSVDSPNNDNVTYFEGLFVQARRPSDPTNFTYGVFDALGDHQLQTIVCDNSPEPESDIENSIGHSIDKHFTVKTFTWTSPANFKENIQFVGTIVRKKIKYWINVRSKEIRVCGSKVESNSGGSNLGESKSTEDSNSNTSSENSLSLLLSAPSFLMWMMTHLVISL